MADLNSWKKATAVFLLCVATAIAAHGQAFATLVNFDGTNGANPLDMSLVQGTDGRAYGMSLYQGSHSGGTVFRITLEGGFTTIYNFCDQKNCADGDAPYAGLALSTYGSFVGTTYGGGTYGLGTVFVITSNGGLNTLHSFDNKGDGIGPTSALVEGIDGNFYGTTSGGNSYAGTVFEITPSGTLTTLHNFESAATTPSGLVQGTDGNLYGATCNGGTNKQGSVFKITPQGKFTRLHSFDGNDGANPLAPLVQASDGNFYGTTAAGGANNAGTIFKLSTAGVLTTLYSFCSETGCIDGLGTSAGLVQATDGNFYGTTELGGANNLGTIFQITPQGALLTLHSFDNSDGANPRGSLLQATNGTFYGTTESGGLLSCDSGYGCGTVFNLDMGLGPFVTFVRAAGKVGQTGGILGQSLTGTTTVSFNGALAKFTVVSDTLIRATVPTGATTGYVTVTTPSRALTSNVPFRVIP
jgi:uncharacterized repeat protein (TIGR03803 family)